MKEKSPLWLSGCITGRKCWSRGSGKQNKNLPDTVFISPRFITAEAQHNPKQLLWLNVTLLTVGGC